MSVYKPKGSPFYHYDFQFHGDRFYGSTGCSSKSDARRFEAEQRRKVALGDQSLPQITIDEVCGTWWVARGQNQRSHKTTRYQLDNLIAGLGRTVRVADVTFAVLQDFAARRRSAVSDASVNRELQLYRRVWRYIADRKAFTMGDEPAWGKLMYREPKERVRELSEGEQERLFEKLPVDLAAIVEFALLSGQRRTSIITMRWSDVDLAGRRSTVTVKGGSRHTFPLTDRMTEIIQEQPRAASKVFTYLCERSAPPRGDRPRRKEGERYGFSLQGWTRKWRKALKDAGIEDFRFHDLRHTAATRLVRASGNLKVAQRLLGHSTITTTSRYAHATDADVLSAMTSVESRNSPKDTAEDQNKIVELPSSQTRVA